jgi:hypothetical protein
MVNKVELLIYAPIFETQNIDIAVCCDEPYEPTTSVRTAKLPIKKIPAKKRAAGIL